MPIGVFRIPPPVPDSLPDPASWIASLESGGAVTGNFASTLANCTMAASGTVANPVTSTFASTLANCTMAASGTVVNPVTGTFASTLADCTMSASGAVANPVTSTFASTLANCTMSATGTAGVVVFVAPPAERLVKVDSVATTARTVTVNDNERTILVEAA